MTTLRSAICLAVIIATATCSTAAAQGGTDDRSFDQKMMLLWFKSVRRHIREAVRGIRTPDVERVSLKLAVEADGSVSSVFADGPPPLVRRVTAALEQRMTHVELPPDHHNRRFTAVVRFGPDSE